jgi:hypothetical protein
LLQGEINYRTLFYIVLLCELDLFIIKFLQTGWNEAYLFKVNYKIVHWQVGEFVFFFFFFFFFLFLRQSLTGKGWPGTHVLPTLVSWGLESQVCARSEYFVIHLFSYFLIISIHKLPIFNAFTSTEIFFTTDFHTCILLSVFI